MRQLTWHDVETGDEVCVQEVRNADCEEPNCPLCGKKTEYWEGTVGHDFQGNDIDAYSYRCYDCCVSTQLEDLD